MAEPPRVAAVVVSHDRRELLGANLAAVAGQTRTPDVVVVVDNASADGSPAMVAERFPQVDLVPLRRNTGGAGGFAVGLARAVQRHHADLVWLMDDDTVPVPDALERLLACRDGHPGRPALVASRVLWQDGRTQPVNTPRRRYRVSAAEAAAAAEVGAVPVRSASFVSVLLDADAVRAVGLPEAAYFLWNDDFDYTTRLLKDRVGLLCGRSLVHHHTAEFGADGADPGDRFYLEVRNKCWVFGHSRGLRPAERLLYGGATLLRWARVLAGSRHRGRLIRAGVRGLRDGLVTVPAATGQVLAGLGDVSDDAARLVRGAVR
jgi:GT2 family glycosyltransferase